MIEGVDGLILDVACGPGTYGRRLAKPSREIYGIDISWGMLRRGQEYLKREEGAVMNFGRAKVEKLPFPSKCFDAAICCGALHLFEDTTVALNEIGRTMKTDAPLAVMTFAAGDAGILKHKWIREHVREDHGAYVFEGPDLRGFLEATSFDLRQWRMCGSLLTLLATRAET
jgi:ubiquinone/menaquinone biosynthesis C-methylase UbiE